jgi:hypothetical protein
MKKIKLIVLLLLSIPIAIIALVLFFIDKRINNSDYYKKNG